MKYMLLFCFITIVTGCDQSSPSKPTSAGVSISKAMGGEADAGFQRALHPRPFHFPQDHYAHPRFATEWWYFTGNLGDTEGHGFGYQLTLFRIGIKPGSVVDDSSWRTRQLYMGHLAISDKTNSLHDSAERFARSAAGLAGADPQTARIWLGEWSIHADKQHFFPLQLQAATDKFAIDLTIKPGSKPRILQGDRGYSRKGAEPGNASFYYSYSRLPTRGTLRLADHEFTVQGNSWFDREWSSSALSDDQQGWDWFSLQLDNGRDVMLYRMRDKQGRAQKYSNGVIQDKDGNLHRLSLQDFEIKPSKYWQNDAGTEYPIAWTLKISRFNIDIKVEATFDDQEMKHTVRYWEGAVEVSGSHTGSGYMELSGYDKN